MPQSRPDPVSRPEAGRRHVVLLGAVTVVTGGAVLAGPARSPLPRVGLVVKGCYVHLT